MNYFHLDAFSTIQIALLLIGLLTSLWLAARWLLASPRRRTGGPGPGHSTLFAAEDSMNDGAGTSNAVPTAPLSHFPSMVEVRKSMNPLTEAEVYLSFGQDREAEALLLAAIEETPKKLGLRIKLAEIYAQRGDADAFNHVAVKLCLMTSNTGPVWDHICELGRQVNPGHPEYDPGASPTRSFTQDETWPLGKKLDLGAQDFQDTGPLSGPVPLDYPRHQAGVRQLH